MTAADMKGGVWVVNFIFTRCAGPCPVMTGRMAELNQALVREGADARLLTITVDPAFDTPEVLKKYGERVGATPDRWKFLTGPQEHVESVIQKGFLQPISPDPVTGPIHSTRFLLIDKEGWIRAFPEGTDPEIVQKLLMDIGRVLRENPENS